VAIPFSYGVAGASATELSITNKSADLKKGKTAVAAVAAGVSGAVAALGGAILVAVIKHGSRTAHSNDAGETEQSTATFEEGGLNAESTNPLEAGKKNE
jgi:hypothetical protein